MRKSDDLLQGGLVTRLRNKEEGIVFKPHARGGVVRYSRGKQSMPNRSLEWGWRRGGRSFSEGGWDQATVCGERKRKSAKKRNLKGDKEGDCRLLRGERSVLARGRKGKASRSSNESGEATKKGGPRRQRKKGDAHFVDSKKGRENRLLYGQLLIEYEGRLRFSMEGLQGRFTRRNRGRRICLSLPRMK